MVCVAALLCLGPGYDFQQCWMETEHGAKSLPPEKRAKVVDQCVKDKMSAAK
jgi:hypothetical protein